jgi:hypothetical protein
MNQPAFSGFRITAVLLAALLGLQCIWLLLAQFSQPGVDDLPTEVRGASIAASHRNDATWAAWIGLIRGDLWAQSAYTYADLLWAKTGDASALGNTADVARRTLDRAVRYAPHQAAAWLLLAGLSSRYHGPQGNSAEALKMSYYTGPSELTLMPLRSLVAAQLPALDDELQIFAKRDLRLLVDRQDKAAIIEAYQSGSPAGKQFIELVLGEIAPTLGASLHLGTQ